MIEDASARHRIRELPVVVLFPHNRCNCRCVMCDIWKIRQVREIRDCDLEPHLSSIRELHVKWVVLSGGEPLMHSDLPALCRLLRKEGVRLTLLTAGLNLSRHAANITQLIDDVIVSIDGPSEIHDRVRAVPGAFRQLQSGVSALRQLQPEMPIHGRSTVQKRNCRDLRRTVDAAHTLEMSSISFLAADVISSAFNRPEGWSPEQRTDIALNVDDLDALDRELDALVRDYRHDIESGFIVERPEKLCRIASHFRSHLGQETPEAPRCNAPWVSAVIEADGSVRPCFFHRAIGNIQDRPLGDIVNGAEALKFRQQLDIPTNPTCRNCVCSLFIPEAHTA